MSEYPTIVDQAGKNAAPIYCSFCAKRDHEVSYIVKGPRVFICNECVGLCVGICRDKGATVEINGDGWQPIDSAPRDGTAVLLGEYRDGEWQWIFDDHWSVGADCWCDATLPPTHWRPLPPAPEEKL